MNKVNWKKFLPELIIVLVFAVASALYFTASLEGKVVYAGDYINGTSAIQESWNHYYDTGEYTFWTNSMFGGMPNYQLGGHRFLIRRVLAPIYDFCYSAWNHAFMVMFFYLLVFYVLLRSFKIDKWTALAGAFAIALSTYFFIIVAAAHNAKVSAITWMTLVLAGFILIFQKRYGWGTLLTMFFLPIGFYIHPQMGYYIFLLIGVFFCAELYRHIREKRWKDLAISTALFAFSCVVGLGMGAANFLANQEYATQTMRGGHSDFVSDDANADAEKSNGLDLDYATAWSYGIDETMTLMIPNFMGGASGLNVGTNSVLYNELTKAGVPQNSAKQFCEHAPVYRGEKAFTSGPVYVGAVICLLFVLGILIVGGPYKWALIAATLFSILLAWGRNFMPLTELFFNYFPMYNKFRAVESILVVAEITMPLLAFLAVKKMIDKENDSRLKHINALYISTAIVGGICLFFALFGSSVIDFTSTYDASFRSQLPDFAYQAILHQRAAMLTADAWRALIFVLLTAVLIWLYIKKDFKPIYLAFALTALIIADMWPVSKRYCNDDNFVSVKQRDRAFQMMPYEKELLKDKTQFRVLNLTTNTFNDARTSYYLKSIGGYSAAKLRRYQDLIDAHLTQMDWNAINMLNAKYIIVKDRDGQPTAQFNPDAMGNCWLVDSLLVAENANEESKLLKQINIHNTAVTDKQFAKFVNTIKDNSNHPESDSGESNTISLVSYTPNRLVYKSRLETPKTAVFSEIYYPFGWHVTIDGIETEHFRANFTLRALNLPQGEHEIVFFFAPDSVRKGDIISLICLAIMLLTCMWFLLSYFRDKQGSRQSDI